MIIYPVVGGRTTLASMVNPGALALAMATHPFGLLSFAEADILGSVQDLVDKTNEYLEREEPG